MRSPGEAVDGDGVLAEVPGDLGLLLWTARDVTLWGEASAAQRDKLFAEGSADARVAGLTATDLPRAVSASLMTINALLALGALADASILSICCLEVAAGVLLILPADNQAGGSLPCFRPPCTRCPPPPRAPAAAP